MLGKEVPEVGGYLGGYRGRRKAAAKVGCRLEGLREIYARIATVHVLPDLLAELL